MSKKTKRLKRHISGLRKKLEIIRDLLRSDNGDWSDPRVRALVADSIEYYLAEASDEPQT